LNLKLNVSADALRAEEEDRHRRIDEIAQRREDAEKQRKLAAELRRRSDEIDRRLKPETPRLRPGRILALSNRRTSKRSNARATPAADDTFQQPSGAAPLWARPEPQVRVVLADEDTLRIVKILPQAAPIVTPRCPSLRTPGGTSGRRELPPEIGLEERKRMLEKQRAELEANKRAFEEFGLPSLKDVVDMTPGDAQSRLPRALSNPDIQPAPFESPNVELAKSRVSRIHDLVHSVKSGLDAENDADDVFESPNERPVFVINNVEVTFPVVSDSDSITYRAEAIRAYLEKELGLQKLLDLRDEVDDQHHGRAAKTELSKTVASGYVVLMWHLVTLDDMIVGI
jgi:hypothetical protein